MVPDIDCNSPKNGGKISSFDDKELNRLTLLGKFSKIISHEIGNSLCKLKLNLDTYKDEFQNSPGLEAVYQTFQTEINRLIKVSNEIKQYSGLTEIIPVQININIFFEKLIEMVSGRLSKKGLNIVNHTARHSIRSDYSKLQTSFLGIINKLAESIDNSIIDITSKLTENDKLMVIISNAAFKTDEAEKILKPYSYEVSSSGLGLLISKQLISDLGGSLSVLSSDNGEPGFEVILPCEFNG